MSTKTQVSSPTWGASLTATGKYRPLDHCYPPDDFVRQWPSKKLGRAPIWCSVCLRDGNQALATPMSVGQKLELFHTLVACGFKEIEVGFPSASTTDFDFVRTIIKGNHIPDDVSIQVLVQARDELIQRTVESLVGAKRVIIHLYNSTSPAQREIVFGKTKQEIIGIAVAGTELVKRYSNQLLEDGTEVVFEYSPESFSATEPEFALEICEAVMAVWQPTLVHRMIINLPDTVEVVMPNVYADQIEWFCKNLWRRNCAIISLHTHNDRGTGVAATELGLLAGADRVEGTLFGNGERTGNLDIITVALNLLVHGIDPGLDFSNLDQVQDVYERCTGMSIPPRHPYAGELVFTAFSGSHQDAIKKGLAEVDAGKRSSWDVPYVIIDPRDLGRSRDGLVRVNSQSGKAGAAYLLETMFDIVLPKEMQPGFGAVVKAETDKSGREMDADELRALLWSKYVTPFGPYKLCDFNSSSRGGNDIHECGATIRVNETEQVRLNGVGRGPLDAFVQALRAKEIANVEVVKQSEHALGRGAGANAISYVWVKFRDGTKHWGIGVDVSIEQASVKAVVSALNRQSISASVVFG